MKILLLDMANLVHRANSGFNKGDYSIVYNFFRQLRAIVEQFEPDVVFGALEGHPRARYEAYAEYKANRVLIEGTNAARQREHFRRQHEAIMDILVRDFPITFLRHADHEADDVIAYLTEKYRDLENEVTIVSTDTDYTQLVESGVRLYNPVKKTFVEWDEDDDYVAYKSLKGDDSDNIKGVPGIGHKKAMVLIKGAAGNPLALIHKLIVELDEDKRDIYYRNRGLVAFRDLSGLEPHDFERYSGSKDWEHVRAKFDEFVFKSITNDKSWKKFVDTFDRLFPTNAS